MFWKNQVFIFDDIVDKASQEKIEDVFLGQMPKWTYVKDVTGGGTKYLRPGFGYKLFSNAKVKSDLFRFVTPLLEATLEKLFEISKEKIEVRLEKSRAFLQFPLRKLDGPEYDNHHIDFKFPHLAVLYYVCDSDGETVLFENVYHPEKNPNAPEPNGLVEKVRVKPKRGRVILFDGYHWHTATQPLNAERRCVINTNLALVSPDSYFKDE